MTPKSYDVQASQCRRLAEGTADPTIKLVLLDIARAWLQLKVQTEDAQPDGGKRRDRRKPSRKAPRRTRAG